MRIADLIERYELLDKRLTQLISDNIGIVELRKIDSQLSGFFDAIADHQPTSLEELRKKFKFYAKQHRQKSNELSIFLDSLVEEISAARNYSKLRPREYCDSPSVSCDRSSILDLVTSSNVRISQIDLEYRYVATSAANSKFYNSEQSSFVGKHVSEIIGDERFLNRAKYYFDESFAGKKQQYFHSLGNKSEERLLSCELIPLFDSIGQTYGSLVKMTDVTDRFDARETLN